MSTVTPYEYALLSKYVYHKEDMNNLPEGWQHLSTIVEAGGGGWEICADPSQAGSGFFSEVFYN